MIGEKFSLKINSGVKVNKPDGHDRKIELGENFGVVMKYP